MLLEHGAEVNSPNRTGRTPLFEATLKQYVHVAHTVLEHGADVNASETEGGETPLHIAAHTGHLSLIKLLL